MIEKLIISLILMFISGVTFIACKHPELYQDKFYGKLMSATLAIYIGSALYDFGVSNAYNELTGLIKEELLAKAGETMEDIKYSNYVFIGFLPTIAYWFFLSWLADNMMQKTKKSAAEEGKDSSLK